MTLCAIQFLYEPWKLVELDEVMNNGYTITAKFIRGVVEPGLVSTDNICKYAFGRKSFRDCKT